MSDQQGKEPKKLSRKLKMFYGVGDFGFTLMSNTESYYFNFFLTNLAMFPLSVVTFITTLSSAVDAVLSWVYGAFLNSIKPRRWGRYRSWLALLPWVVPFLFAFQFVKLGDGPLAIAVIIIASITSHIAWNIPYVANVSMIAVAGKTPEDRSQLSATRAAWSNLSKVVFSYLAPVVASISAGLIGEVNQWGGAAFAFGCVMAILYGVHFRMFKGYEEEEPRKSADTVKLTKEEKKAEKNADKDKTNGMDLVRALFKTPPLIFLLIADLAMFMFNFVVMGFATYYFTYVANAPGMLAPYILVTNIFCVIGGYCSKFFSNKFSTRSTAIVIMAIQAVMLIISFLFYNNYILVVILMSVAMFGYGITYACMPALFGDCIVYSEWKTGKNATGWISGLQNTPLKISIMTRGIIISACLAMGAFSAEMDPAAATVLLKRSISFGFMGIPAIALIVAVFCLLFGFRLTRDKVNQYAAEIAARS